MKAREFFDIVVEMRKAQQRYFKTRKTNDLIESRRIEKVVDEEIDRVTKILDARAAAEALRTANTMKAAAAIAKHMGIEL